MDGQTKALAQLREGLERALGFIRAKRKTAGLDGKIRAQLVEWEQKLEALLAEAIQAGKSGLLAATPAATGILGRAGEALVGFARFAQESLGGLGQSALDGAMNLGAKALEGAAEGAKLAARHAKEAGKAADGARNKAGEVLEGAIEGAARGVKDGAKGILRSMKNAQAAEPGQGGGTPGGAGPGGSAAGGTGAGGSPVGSGPAPGAGPGGADNPGTPAGATEPVPIGGHVLPPLPYAYNGLEPYIDEQTMRIHHDKHHLAYVEGLNRAERALQEARQKGDFALIKHWERELAFHGAGHYLHSIFWKAMAPKAGGRPTGDLATLIDRDFGSLDAFKAQFSKAAEEVEGGGWAILVWAPRAGRLQILQAEKHQNLSQQDVIPLLPLDVWEHSYYLKYQNRRGEYVKNWWNVVNWPFVAKRLAEALKVQWPRA